VLQYVAVCCSVPQCYAMATHCNTLQHTATYTTHFCILSCSTLQHTATHYNTLQHTATHCNTLQHTATHFCILSRCVGCCRLMEKRDSHVSGCMCLLIRDPYVSHVCNYSVFSFVTHMSLNVYVFSFVTLGALAAADV